MAGIVGLNQFAEHSIAGSAFAAFSLGQSGRMGYDGGEANYIVGIGGVSLRHRGMVVPVGTLSTALQVADLISCIEPTSLGSLPPIVEKIQGGEKTTSNKARLHEDCYLSSVKFSCANEGVVMVEYNWMALSETEATTVSSFATQSTAEPFPWHNMTPQFDSGDLDCQSWEVTVETGIAPRTSNDVKSSGVARLPEWMDPGDFKVSLSATVATNPGVDIKTDYPTAMGFKVVALNGTSTFTIDLTGGNKVDINVDEMPLVTGPDQVLHQITGTTRPNDLAAFAVTFV